VTGLRKKSGISLWKEQSYAESSVQQPTGNQDPSSKQGFSLQTQEQPLRQASRGSTAERRGRRRQTDSDGRCSPLARRNISIRVGARGKGGKANPELVSEKVFDQIHSKS